MSIRLLPLRPGDADRILPLVRAFYAHFDYPFSPRRQGTALRCLLADGARGAAWAVERRGAVVGYAVLAFVWSIEYGGRCGLLDELFVAAPHRGRGIGTAVIRRLRDEARRLGLRRLLLEVEAGNRRARRLYGELGFRDTHRRLMTRPIRGKR